MKKPDINPGSSRTVKSRILRTVVKLESFSFCILISIFTFCTLHFLSGCAEIKPPHPKEIMRQPLGESPLRLGMTKEKVRSLWSEPDLVRVLGADPQGMMKEEWIYRGRYPNLPINVDYLAETQHLFFDGDYLVKFEHRR